MSSLESISLELKDIVATYDTQWFLGDLSGLMKAIASGRANDQLGKLSSPQRQLYFLAGLLITSDPSNGIDIQFTHQKWNKIVTLLNGIEREYGKLFFPNQEDKIDEQWQHVREVIIPSFLTYFNQGPLNYEEQIINWVSDLYSPLNEIIERETGLNTADFVQFYENVDFLNQRNFSGIASPKGTLRDDWKTYTKIEMINTAPPILGFKPSEKEWAQYHFMSDHGIINRFYPNELVSSNLSNDKVVKILSLLTCVRSSTDFIYYTATKPGNPLYEKPIIDIGNDMYQVFEVKQVIHSIESLLGTICSKTKSDETRLTKKKGKLLEDRVVELFSMYLQGNIKVFRNYFIDGNEQDILILWRKYAFIIEAKGYTLREPLRDPNRAFVRIKNDFDKSIGYGYTQTRRVERKFIDGMPLLINDKNGMLLEEIDTTQYDSDFSIVVNIQSFGQIQCDLSTLIKLENDDDVYPWAVKLDDLETFLLTLKAKGKNPMDLVDFLLLRETMHGKLICSDESELCGAFLEKKLNKKIIEKADKLVTTPDLADVFDKQYYKGMGLKNEKYLAEKKSGKYIFF